MAKHTLGALGAAMVLAASGVGCGGGSSGNGTGGNCDPCTGNDSGTTGGGNDTNPYGVAYPSPASGYGHTPRTGSTPGSIIQNFKFLGYPTLAGDGTYPASLSTISLADYYDPCAKKYKLIHLSMSSVWCVPCNQETDAIVGAMSQLAGEQIVVLGAIDEGPTQGIGATVTNLQFWVQEHKSNFPTMLDPEAANLNEFFNAAAIPWNADIDPRTMELVNSVDGYNGSITSEISLSNLPTNPGYPIPSTVQCN
jgi:hypothetical protein